MKLRGYITTNRLLIGCMALLVGVIMISGLFFPESYIMRFADDSLVYALIRGLTFVVLVSLLISSPPRSMVFRFLLGVLAIVLTSVSVDYIMSYKMGLLDAAIFIEVSIIFVIEALELRENTQEDSEEPAIQTRRLRITST